MGTALVWSSFLISATTAKAIARGTPTVAPMVPLLGTTTDTVHMPSLSSTPWVWPTPDTSTESFSITWSYSSGFEPAPSSFPDVPSTSRQFVIAPLESTAYPTPPAFAPHPTKRAAVTETPTSIYDGDVWSWSNLPTTSDRKTWSIIFDSIISSALHDTRLPSSDVGETTSSTSASDDDTTVFTTTTVVVTMTRHKPSTKTGTNTLTTTTTVNTNRARAEVTNPSVLTKRAAVAPTSIYDGDAWSWSNLPKTTSDKNIWSVMFDSILSSALHDTKASDVCETTTSTSTGVNTNRIRAEVTTPTGCVNTNRDRAEVTNPSVFKKVVTTKTTTALVPDRNHVRAANTAPGSFLTLAAKPKKTKAAVPKKGCVMSPLCGSDRNLALPATPGLKMARISTSSCVERGTTCSIGGVLNPSDEYCQADCICVCQ